MAGAEEDIVFENAALTDDALDRRAALTAAIDLQTGGSGWLSREHDQSLLARAETFYNWLRQRDTLKLYLTISAGPPQDQSAS
jgi:hypothetical protein